VSAQAWVDERLPCDVLHFDVAAAGRVSRAVLDAELGHLEAEARLGAYVAEVAAGPALASGRDALAALVGLSGADLAFSDGASSAFAAVLDAWPLPAGSRIGTVPGEFASNSRLLERRAAERDWRLVDLPVDGLGRVTDVPADLDLLAFPHVASQVGVAQPVEDVLGAGVPLVLDVAQSAGQVPVPPGAAAYVGTSRKWLCGPRGVGFAVVAPHWHDRLTLPPTLQALEYGGMQRFDGCDPNVAGRVGLSLAARTWSPALLPVVQAAAAAARVLLQGAGDWQVVEPVDEPTAITTLRHATADPAATRLAPRGWRCSRRGCWWGR
jgi:hercynylcysteine S-oxide lyase